MNRRVASAKADFVGNDAPRDSERAKNFKETFVSERLRAFPLALFFSLAHGTKKMQHKFLRLNQVRERTGLPRSTIYAYVMDGTFPTPINIGERSVAWLETDIEQWMSEKILCANHTKWSARHD